MEIPKELMVIEDFDKQSSFDKFVTEQNIPGCFPEQYFAWRLLPGFYKKYLKRTRNHSNETFWVSFFGLSVIYLFIYHLFTYVYGITGEFALVMGSFVMVLLSMFTLVSIADAAERAGFTEEDRRQEVYKYYKNIIGEYRQKFFNGSKGEFGRIDLKFQQHINASLRIHERFENLRRSALEGTPIYEELGLYCREAEEYWEIVEAENEKFQIRKKKVLAGLDRLELNLDLISKEYSFIEAKKEFNVMRKSAKNLIDESSERYYRLAVELGTEIEKMSNVLQSLTPYSGSIDKLHVPDLVSLDESRHQLVAASLSSEGLDKAIDELGIIEVMT